MKPNYIIIANILFHITGDKFDNKVEPKYIMGTVTGELYLNKILTYNEIVAKYGRPGMVEFNKLLEIKEHWGKR